MEQFEKLEVLPTTIYKYKLPEKLLKEILSNLENFNWDAVPNREDEFYYGKSQKGENSLHTDKKYKNLKIYLNKCLEQVKEDQGFLNIEKLSVCLMWVNRSFKGQWHHTHIHPWSYLSGIIYLTGNSGKTWFSRNCDYNPSNNFSIRNPDDNINRIIHRHTPEPGTMLIFPSAIPHSVDENLEDEPRITLSFNSFPEGRVGNVTTLSGLNLKII